MNIKTFLIENYIWIIVIILITIITIIGFLADKKKNDKKKADTEPANPNPNTAGQMQYNQLVSTLQNQMDNNMEQNNSIPNQMIQPIENNQNIVPVNEVTPIMPVTENQQGMMNQVDMSNNINTIENIAQSMHQEQVYQPLSEQTPSFEPQPIPNFNNINNQNFATPVENNGFNQNMNMGNQFGMPEQNMQQPMMQNPMNQQNNQMPNQNQNIGQAPVSFVFGPQNNNQNM